MKAIRCRVWMPERDHCRPTDPLAVSAEVAHAEDIPWREPFEANAVIVPLAEWQALIEAAAAVVARWDSPTWKDAPATAEYIATLRAALDAVRPR